MMRLRHRPHQLPEFVNRLEVLKSPTADVEEGGLSGTVIARTVRPLDIGEFKLAGSVQYARELLSSPDG